MDKTRLDITDQKLLGLLQAEFPLSIKPFVDLGEKLGLNQDEVIERIQQLKLSGIVRQISPVLDARRLGYQPTLVAMRVNGGKLERAEEFIAAHPGVSHGYERDHYYNLWFTLAAPGESDADSELERLTGSIGPEAAFALPAIKVFKIGAYFGPDASGAAKVSTAQPVNTVVLVAELSDLDRMVINESQQDLPLIHTPFSAMAERTGMDEEHFLAQCRSLKQRGIIRRYGAAINHRKAGFQANAMTCWVAPPEKLDIAGRLLASLKEVSHCYERMTNPAWQYNLFAMIHQDNREACQRIAGNVSEEAGLTGCLLLYSTREFKKTRIKYLV